MIALKPRQPFKLGFLTHAFGSDPRQVYRDLQEQFEFAEALGFDGGWIAQPSPDRRVRGPRTVNSASPATADGTRLLRRYSHSRRNAGDGRRDAETGAGVWTETAVMAAAPG